MKILFLLITCSLCLADSAVPPAEYFKTSVIPGVTVESSEVVGAWENRQSGAVITLTSPDGASLKIRKDFYRGSWAMQGNGVIVVKLQTDASKEFALYCYVRNGQLIEDQICTTTPYSRMK